MLHRLMATAAVALALSAPAFAGSTDSSAQQTEAQAPTEQPAALDSGMQPVDPAAGSQTTAPDTAAAPSAAAPVSNMPIIEAEASDEWRAQDVIGLPVATSSEETVGKVNDLLLAKDGNIRGIVLSIGGFLGVGDKLVAMPWDAVAVDPQQELVIVRLSQEELEAAPAFKTQEQIRAEQEALLRQKEQTEQIQQQQQQGMQPPAATE